MRKASWFGGVLGGLVVAVVMAALPAIAGDGDAVLGGRANFAMQVTQLRGWGGLRVTNTTPGGEPAAWFLVESGPPFVVNSAAKVAGLNADRLDGLHAAAFARAAHDHDWSELTSGVPAGLADGDDDALGSLACAAGEVAKRNGAGTAWECAADTDTDTTLSDGEVVAAVLAGDGAGSGLDADLVDGKQASAFSLDGHGHDWSELTSGVPAGLADGDDDALGSLACAAGEVAKRNGAGTAWECAADTDTDTTLSDGEVVAAVLAADGVGSGLDADTLDGHDTGYFALDDHAHAWGDLTSGVPAGLGDGDDDTLGALDCAAGEVAKRNGADTAWECAADLGSTDADTLDGLDSTDFLGADDRAADSAALGGAAPGLFVGGAVADGDGLPILGVGCLLRGGFLAAIARDGSPYCSPSTGAGTFTDTGQDLGSGGDGYAVALGDVDGDGDLDAFVANSGQANKVWLNDGHGAFTDSGQALGLNYSRGVALGDLDGDGDLDAFVVNTAQANRVYLNDGSGTFSNSGQSLGGTAASRGVALGDLDGDGDLDAFVVNTGQANDVYLNNGSGTFTDSGQDLGSANSISVALGDLDGDGDLDAYVGNNSQDNRIWVNGGSGTFTGGSLLGGGSPTFGVAIGDLDGDGDLDLYDATGSASGDIVWLNDGAGSFATNGETYPDSSTGFTPVLGDLDGDGDLDVFVSEYGGDRVWFNDGDGTFTSGGSLGDSRHGYGCAVGDLDGDGDLDVFVSNEDLGDTVWLD